MKVIGITGGVGSGKSKILSYISENYLCRIFMADEIGKKVQEPGNAAYEEMLALFGQEYLVSDGSFNRAKIAAALYADAAMRKRVEDIVHPAVRQFIQKGIEEERKKNTPLVFIEAALLIEAGYMDILDELWYIYADVATRTMRLAEGRGYSEAKSQAIMAAQLCEKDFMQHASVIIDNSGAIEDTYRKIDELMGENEWRA